MLTVKIENKNGSLKKYSSKTFHCYIILQSCLGGISTFVSISLIILSICVLF
jgi:hypothetical protein